MHSFNGDFRSVGAALFSTINDLLEGPDEKLSLFNRDFGEGSSLLLYQHPIEGWITKDPDRLGSRGCVLRFLYSQESSPPSLELKSCEGSNPISPTALKTALLISKLFRECQVENQDIPAAQPLSLSDWNFPIKSIWISVQIFKQFKESEKVRPLWEKLSAAPPEADFAIGMPCAAECGISPLKVGFSLGDIVVVKRSEGAPTFAKVIQAGPLLKVAVRIEAGRPTFFKEYSPSQISRNILARL